MHWSLWCLLLFAALWCICAFWAPIVSACRPTLARAWANARNLWASFASHKAVLPFVGCWTKLCGRAKSFVGWDLGYARDSHHGVEIGLAIFGFIVTQGIAVVVTDYLPTVKWKALMFFAFSAFFTLGAFVFMIAARKTADSTGPGSQDSTDADSHYYDRSTVKFVWWVFGWSALFIALFIGAGAADLLPGSERPTSLPIIKPDIYTFSDGKKGVEAYILLTPTTYRGKLPEKLSVELNFKNDFQRRWKIETARGFIGDPAKDVEMGGDHPDAKNSFPPTLPHGYDQSDANVIMLLRKLQPEETYWLSLRFMPSKDGVAASDGDLEIAVKEIKAERAFEAIVRK